MADLSTPLLAGALIVMALSLKRGTQNSLSLPEIKTEILKARPLSAGRLRFLMGQIISPNNEEPTFEKYQTLLDLSQRPDFQDFPALFRALAQLKKQGKTTYIHPI